MFHRRPPDVLPPYTGDTATCAKCGHVGADTEWRPPETTGGEMGRNPVHWPERLVRRCTRCRFIWDEAPLDAAG